MRGFENRTESTLNTLTALELKQLLISLGSIKKICFRFRQMGEMWMKNHMRGQGVNDKSVMLHDEQAKKFYLVKINTIVQFDLDERFQLYQPHNHYNVTPSPELD